VRFAALTTAAIASYAVLTHVVLLPLHEQGVCQPLTAALQGLDYLLQAPGLGVAQKLGLRAGHHTTLTAWLFSLTLNWIVYFLAALAGWAFWRWLSCPAASSSLPLAEADAGSASSGGPVYSRRRFLTRGLKGVSAGAVAGLGYALLIEPRRFVVTHRSLSLRGLPPALDGLRLLQLTDIHHGPWLSLGYVREVVRASNALAPDLICLTGDYVHHSAAFIEPVVAELARLRPRIGIVAVLGNHDWWEDVERMRQEFAEVGIPLLDNTRLVLTPERHLVAAAEVGLALCGVGDLWMDTQEYEQSLGRLPEEMPRLLLSHNPDVAEEPGLVRGGRRVDLMLSGHTHGGQVWLPGLGAPVTSSRYGQKYAQGLVQGPVCPVFICRGIGVSGMPLRLGVSPEIALLELRAGSS
jgi:predicted MPP superfamily phosphohydrolase